LKFTALDGKLDERQTIVGAGVGRSPCFSGAKLETRPLQRGHSKSRTGAERCRTKRFLPYEERKPGDAGLAADGTAAVFNSKSGLSTSDSPTFNFIVSAKPWFFSIFPSSVRSSASWRRFFVIV